MAPTAVLDAPAGQVELGHAAGLVWVWQERSEHPADTNMGEHGAVVHQLVGHSPATGVAVAYLRVEWFCPDALEEAFPDLWHFQAKVGGWSFDPDSLEDTWRAACRYRVIAPPADAAQVSAQRMRSDLDRAAAELCLQRQFDMRAEWGQFPFPAASKVEKVEGFGPGQGVGAAMYSMAAELLGARGQVLWASTLQSEEAKALWAKLATGPWPTRTLDLPAHCPGAQPSQVLCLDYTGR